MHAFFYPTRRIIERTLWRGRLTTFLVAATALGRRSLPTSGHGDLWWSVASEIMGMDDSDWKRWHQFQRRCRLDQVFVPR
jgi:hypothetical protein